MGETVDDNQIAEVVTDGYDKASYVYRRDEDPTAEETYRKWLEPILQGTGLGASVLDVGSGCGLPASRILSERFAVTGVDVSSIQIERARSLVQNGKFIVWDITVVGFPEAVFDAVVNQDLYCSLREAPPGRGLRMIGSESPV